MPTKTRLPTKTLTQTPPPTLTSEELVQADQEIKRLLQNGDVCYPPCFLEVVPGQTTLAELKSIFLQWGISLKNGSDKSYAFNYQYNNSNNLHVVFTLKEDIVKTTSINFYQDEPYQWALYSPSALLKRFGVPSSVEFLIGEIHDWPNPTPLKGWYFMLIRYADLDMVVEYYPVEIQQGLIVVCPNLDYYGGGRVWLGEHSISNYTSLEDATSITLQKFYDFILSGPGACFYLDTNNVVHG
jgi:hypothetical protein